jgi:C4-dicarboxylate-specific signal transduction histidine kinase
MNGTSRFLATVRETDKGDTRNTCNQFGFETVALIPIRVQEKIVGMIHIADDRENMIPAEMMPLLEQVGVQVGVAIERSWATDREESLRKELVHIGRLTTMGEMASGLAHELNQPLAAIEMFAHVASHYAKSGNERNEHKLIDACEKISAQAMRAGELVHRMRRFVKKVEPSITPLNFADILHEVIPLVENDFRLADIMIEVDVDSSLPMVIADKVQVEQVLLNLTRNALEAMQSSEADGGELSIEAVARDGFLEIAVHDSGDGIPTEELDEAFSTFYSTKPEGMGLGLPISRSIIEAHGGKIRAESTPGRGTTFTFTLPTGTVDQGSELPAEPVTA